MPTFTQRENGSNNDGYFAGSWFTNPTSYILVGWNNFLNAQNYSAFRFTNVTIPHGATISSATLELTAETTESNAVDTQLAGILEDNTADLSSDPSGRPRTSNTVAKNYPSGITNNSTYDYDCTAFIQELVNRAGWGSGQALAFMLILNSGASGATHWLHFHSHLSDSTKSPLLTVVYTTGSTNSITKSLKYTTKITPPSLSKLLRYSILDQELMPVSFRGLKVAKAGHNVLNTKNPNNLNFSTDYNTLKYYLSGVLSIAVNESLLANTYTKTVTLTHSLGFYPVCLAYVQDDRMANPQPMGRFQAGSGASRSFYYTISKTQITFMVNGFWLTTPDTYTVYFYYKVFKNNIGL